MLSIADNRILDGYPDDTDDNIHPLALSSVVLEAPHAISLLVPESLGGRVHAPASHVRLAVSSCGGSVAGADAWFFRLCVGATFGLVESCRGNEVLDDGRVDDEFMGRSLRGVGGCGFGNQSL